MKARIEIRSFIGISAGAVHYYGTLNIIGGECEVIELTRPLTQKEIDADNDRWYAYEEGEATRCFNSWEDVIKSAGEKMKELGIAEEEVSVEGVPNNKRMTYKQALGDVDTRLRCCKCGKTILHGEGCYNTPSGIYCVGCYER